MALNLAPIIPAIFTGPNGEQLTPEQIRDRQLIAQSLMAQATDTSPNAGGWTSILAKGVQGFQAGRERRGADNAVAGNNTYNSDLLNSLLNGPSTSATSSPIASAATSGVGQEMASTSPAPNVSPEIASGIVETANALGIDPVDLGTAISYETAGTFDPTKAGPTTQWGQHKGLIQFGEPQAKQYGVDWNDPVGSQLGANGAVANYLRSTGVKPGMGMMDVYSAINAGRVGRYGASDANNGGAPGTVADKVNRQMAGHRAKAMALLGDNGNPGSMSPERATSYSSRLGTPYQPAQAAIEQVSPSGYVDPVVSAQPQAAPQSGFDGGRFGNTPAASPMAGAVPEIYSAQTDFAPELAPPVNVGPAPAVAAVQQPAAQPAKLPQAPSANTAIIAQALRVMGDPRANDGTRRVAQALLQQEQQKQQFSQEQSVWQQRQDYERQQQANDPLRQAQIAKLQREAATGGETFFGNPIPIQNPDGSVAYGQIGNQGTFRPIQLGQGQTFAPPTKTIDTGTETLMLDQAGNVVSRTPKQNREAAAQTSMGSAEGKSAAETASEYSSITSKMPGLYSVVDRLSNLADKATYTLAGQALDFGRSQVGMDPREAAVARAEYTATIDNQILPLLKDTFGAQFTDAEGLRLAATLGDANKTPTEKQALLKAFIQQKERDIEALRARTGRTEPQQSSAPAKPASRLKFNPQTGELE